MRNILSSLIIIFSISCAFADDQCSGRNYNSTQCNNIAGCYYDTDYNSCEQCNSTEYSYSGETICTECSDFAFTEASHKIYDTTTPGQAGQSECPWICDTGYFDDDEHTECLSCPDASHPKSYGTQDITNIGTCTCPTNTNLIKTTESNGDKYYCGTCGVGTASTTGNITTCTCPATSNQVHGNQAYRTNNGPVECACPDGASWNSQLSKCVCTDTNKTIVLDNETGLYVCSSCSNSNATLDGNVCKCNAGYYGPQNGLTTECTQCPIGTTTTIGAQSRSDCQMNHNTKFCYGSDDNKKCMHLIPAGTVISVSNNT